MKILIKILAVCNKARVLNIGIEAEDRQLVKNLPTNPNVVKKIEGKNEGETAAIVKKEKEIVEKGKNNGEKKNSVVVSAQNLQKGGNPIKQGGAPINILPSPLVPPVNNKIGFPSPMPMKKGNIVQNFAIPQKIPLSKNKEISKEKEKEKEKDKEKDSTPKSIKLFHDKITKKLFIKAIVMKEM